MMSLEAARGLKAVSALRIPPRPLPAESGLTAVRYGARRSCRRGPQGKFSFVQIIVSLNTSS